MIDSFDMKSILLLITGIFTITLLGTGCGEKVDTVVVYTALDREFSEPIFKQFEQETGIRVLPKYDTESTKTVGLVNALISESNHPRCDVFWNNEIINTIRLKNKGLLQPCSPENAKLYPETFRDEASTWFGFAARARVIIVNTNLVAEENQPRTLIGLTNPSLKGKVGIAKPLFGTTASHIACLFSALGPKKAKKWLQDLKENDISIESGNKNCALKVANGKLHAALTDTDDAFIELQRGAPVKIVFPDSQLGELGTLMIPNTLSLINNCPHPDSGTKLINYLLSASTEATLARSASAQIPLNNTHQDDHPLGTLPHNLMVIDFVDTAEQFEKAAAWIRNEFLF